MMSKIGIILLTGALLVCVALVAPALADEGETIHPYQLYPFEPVPGRPGFGTPEIQPHYEEWREAMEEGDEERASEIISQFASSHFMHGHPQFLPYPGSIEHVRADWQRYVPPYPLYNHHTLVENFILNEYPQTQNNIDTFEETLYWFSQWNRRFVTSATRELDAFVWEPGESIEFTVGPLESRKQYIVRVIGALNPEDVIRFTTVANPDDPINPNGAEKQLVFQFEINDKPDGGVSTYYMRGRTWDQMYDTVSCPWNSMDEREYNIRITLLEESEATLYAYNVDVHNVFGQTAQRAGKERATTFDPDARREKWLEQGGPPERQPLSAEARAQRDENLWRSIPPINHMIDRYPRRPEDAGEYVRAGWDIPANHWRRVPWDQPWHLVRRNENGEVIDTYTWEDMAEYKPLPGTEDQGYGVRFEEPRGGRHVLSYLAHAHMERMRWQGRQLYDMVDRYDETGDERVARDAAFLLARFVYHMPSLRGVNYITFTERFNPIYRGDDGRGGRYSPAHWGNLILDGHMESYDKLFDFIKDNQELADALGKYIPWIETPEDVRYLFEVYGLQYEANEYLHYRAVTGQGQAPGLTRLALIQNDNEISKPWMEFLFKLSWQYPQALAGVDDTVVTSMTRDGVHDIGSWAYANDQGLDMAEMTGDYVEFGGDPKFDLGDFRRYAKSYAGAYYFLESRVGGGFYPGIGDVGGPARPINYQMNKLTARARRSWQVTRDPRFAWYLVESVGRENESDEEWQEILDAAATIDVNPVRSLRSRILPDWFAALEGGAGDPDFRFHRAIALNVGDCGTGHAHQDTFDLRIWALGANMSGDLGQRQSYGRPRHNATHSHNLVEVDGDGSYWTSNPGRWDGYAWVRNLFDAPGAHYLFAESTPPANHQNVDFYKRHVSLVDVDEGEPSNAADPEADADVVLPSSYIFDVNRISGGNRHTYCFHGAVDDNHIAEGGFDVNVVNREIVTPRDDTPEGEYLQNFRWTRFALAELDAEIDDLDKEWAADPADDTLVATWRMGEATYNRSLANAAVTEGRKYMRMHLFNVGDHRVLHGINTDTNGANRLSAEVPHYSGRMLYVQQDSEEPLESVYVALLEPFSGEPQIVERRLLDVQNNEADALRAAAVAVETANGHTDILFNDGRPETARLVESPLGGDPIAVQGEYAFVSYDEDGLRQATLTGGDHILAPGIELRLSYPEYRGAVSAVDYLDRVAVVNGLPSEPELEGLFFEIGNDGHRTSFEVDEIGLDEDGNTTIHLRKSIEMMLATVLEADYEAGTVTTNVAMRKHPGRDKQLIATNEDFDNRWRADYVGGNRFDGYTFDLKDRPITNEDFPVGGKLSVFAFGEGDEVVLKTGASLRRVEEGVWQVYANAPFTTDLEGAELEWSADGETWHDVEAGEELGPGRGQPREFMLRVR